MGLQRIGHNLATKQQKQVPEHPRQVCVSAMLSWKSRKVCWVGELGVGVRRELIHCWWWTGRPGVLRFMGSQRVRHDWANELNTLSNAWTKIRTVSLQMRFCNLYWMQKSQKKSCLPYRYKDGKSEFVVVAAFKGRVINVATSDWVLITCKTSGF